MQIRNREKERLNSSIGLKEFGEAMASLDLQSIPPHKRPMALMEHFLKIQAQTIHDRDFAEELQGTIDKHQKLKFLKAVQEAGIINGR